MDTETMIAELVEENKKNSIREYNRGYNQALHDIILYLDTEHPHFLSEEQIRLLRDFAATIRDKEF